MYLSYQEHIGTGDLALDNDIQMLEVLYLPTGFLLQASTGVNGGVVSYAFSTDGRFMGVTDIEYFPEDTLNTRTIEAAIELDVETIRYTINQDNGEVALHGENGTTSTQSITLEDVTALGTVHLGSQSFLLAAQYGLQGISSYQINTSTGVLNAVDDIGASDGLGVSTPTTFETVTAFGQTWIILGSAGSSTISVLQLSADGHLSATDHLLDTLGTRFGGVQSVATAQVGDRVFIVAGGGDDGLSLLTLLPDGQLLHLDSIPHTLGAGLMNVGQIEASVMGNTLQIFVSSGVSDGIALYSIDLSDLGLTMSGAGTGADLIEGSSGGDLLTAGTNDTILGGTGDDILVGAPGARLEGGEGADTFVLGNADGTTHILDFTPGEDQLDLSSYSMLRSPDQLNIISTASGAQIQFRDTFIEIFSASGAALELSDFFATRFEWADRIPILEAIPEPEETPEPPIVGGVVSGTDGSDSITGSTQDDTLFGGTGEDTLKGEAGDDVLIGESGDDVHEGGAGDDWISGAAGHDTLRGDSGNDTLGGGTGNDYLDGGNDNDILRGGDNDDTVAGGNGNDNIFGESGNDTLLGGTGYDTISGGDGDDVLYGGAGNDLMVGINGNDTLFGEDGNDTLSGADGKDLFYGGAGDDTIWGGHGNDTVWGGSGNDMLGGSEDNDLMYGEDGNDTVWGGSQHDTLYGGEGVDTVGGFWGNDLAFGGEGDDFVWGNFGNDTLYGENGNDSIGGAEGDDVLIGGAGNDTLIGGDDTDTLMGGTGDDDLRGGAGDDWLSGGTGADTFYFFYNHKGADQIADFETAVDVIQFDTGNVNFGTLNMHQQDADVIITLNRGQITLVDTNLADLGVDHFLFG